MVNNIIDKLCVNVNKLKDDINKDIEDIKIAKNDELLKRNDEKQSLIDNISKLKTQLNEELVKQMKEGIDVNLYKDSIDSLEESLKDLYILNKKLAAIVLPIQKMYKELVEEISIVNGGKAFDIKA